MDYMTVIEETIMKLKGMETQERYMTECECMADGDRCMHLNNARELKQIWTDLEGVFKELEKEWKE